MTEPGDQVILVFNEYEREDVRQFCCDDNLDSDYMLRRQEDLIGLLMQFAKLADDDQAEEMNITSWSRIYYGRNRNHSFGGNMLLRHTEKGVRHHDYLSPNSMITILEPRFDNML